MKIIIYVLFVFVLNGCTSLSLCTKSYKKRSVDFPKEIELAVWEKATPTKDPNIRLDVCNTKIHLNQYGNIKSQYGWEIDHIKPKAKCGRDKIKNLQPLHWKTNRSKSNKWVKFKGIKPKDYCPQKTKKIKSFKVT